MKFSRLLLLLPVLALAGCADRSYWHERHEPTTDAERQAVTAHVEKLLAATPRTLSGNDQDWDDAIAEASRQARFTLCRPTFWEYRVEGFMGSNAYYSGKWRYADAAASK